MADTARRTVSNEVARFFEKKRLISPILNNKRKISVAAFSSSSSEGSRSSSSSSSSANIITSASFQAVNIDRDIETVEIPADLESKETYALMGFDDATAALLWDNYTAACNDRNLDDPSSEIDFNFYEFAYQRLRSGDANAAASGSDDWDRYMRGKGINDRLRRAILLPEFADIRCTATCQFWLIKTISRTWKALTNLDKRLKEEASRMEESETPGQPGSSSSASTGLTARHPPSQSPPKKSKGLSPPQQAGGSARPTVASQPPAPASLPDHTMLFRADDRTITKTLSDPHVLDVVFNQLASSPGDFSGRNRVLYWTPQREVADKFASYMKGHVSIDDLVVLQVAVPHAWVETLQIEYLWYGEGALGDRPADAWKKVIWVSRGGGYLEGGLKYITAKALLIGHIAHGEHSKFFNLPESSLIKRRDVLRVKIDGEMKDAIQWVFQTAEAEQGFKEHTAGKLWLHWMRVRKDLPQ